MLCARMKFSVRHFVKSAFVFAAIFLIVFDAHAHHLFLVFVFFLLLLFFAVLAAFFQASALGYPFSPGFLGLLPCLRRRFTFS